MILLSTLLMIAGCGEESGDDTGGADGACADAPLVTWENFGQGFLTENCQTCHASTTLDRHGAPENVTFDTKDQALALSDLILAMATGPEPTMPPEGGVSDDDRYLLETWLTCWE